MNIENKNLIYNQVLKYFWPNKMAAIINSTSVYGWQQTGDECSKATTTACYCIFGRFLPYLLLLNLNVENVLYKSYQINMRLVAE